MIHSRTSRTGPGEPSTALVRAITRLARPLVHLLITRGITYPYLANLLKTVYVAVATESLGEDATTSRVSVVTGLQRKDIRRIQSEPPPDAAAPPAISIGARLIGIWTGNARFRAKKTGEPLVLPRTSEGSRKPSFDELVRTVSTDIRPRVILDEWLRLGIVTVDPEGSIRLNSDAFVPQQGFDEKAYYLGRNVADHIATSVHNLLSDGTPWFERAVYYDRLTPESIAYLRKRANELGMKTLLALNNEALRRADGDAERVDAKQRMALGIYFFEGPDEAASEKSR